MLDRVFTTISRYNMLAGGERVVAAVSGGPDSVCLLEVLACLAPRLGITLSGVAHFNHKLRGEESEGDERLVAALAAGHKIPFYRAEADPAWAGNLEQEARRARQKFFQVLIREGKADHIALGHTRDDQAETVLFRLLRGSGLAGLAGVLPVTREGFMRPLLDCTRAEVVAYLAERQIGWRQDSSNDDQHFTRNRIRHDLLPKLARDYNPRVAESLSQLAELAREEEDWWDGEMVRLSCRFLVIGSQGVEIRAADLSSLPKPVGRRLTRYAIRMAKGNLRRMEFQHVERIMEMAASSTGTGRSQLPGLTVTRSLDWLRFAIDGPAALVDALVIEPPGRYTWGPTDTDIVLEVTERKGSLSPDRDQNPYGTLEVELSWNKVQGPLELRGWRFGDAYWPQGRGRVHPVSDLFQELRVPSWRRSGWPILCYRAKNGKSEILWASGFGGAQRLVAGADSGPVLRISEKRESFAPA